jgi:very-short-patch-repair endonuclease
MGVCQGLEPFIGAVSLRLWTNSSSNGYRKAGIQQPMDNTQEIDPSAQPLSAEQKRLFDVLTLIENVCKQETPTPTVEEHKGFLGWESDLRGLPGIVFNLDNEGDSIWMEVKRLVPMTSPARAASLNPWVEKSDDPNKEPILLQQIVVQVAWAESKTYAAKVAAGEDIAKEATGFELDTVVDEIVTLDERPEIKEEFTKYKDELWLPWAEAERPRRATIKIYSQLFDLMRRMDLEGASDRTEIVWGMGIAVGSIKEQKIRYPLVTQGVFVTIDEATSAILVRPRSSLPVLESLNYEKLEVPGVKELIARFKEWLEKDRPTLSPFVSDTFFDVTRTAAAQLSERGVYWPDVNTDTNDRSIPKTSDGFVITDSWVLFSRKKSTHFFVDDVRGLKEDVKKVEELEGGARAIVADPSDEQRPEPRRNYRGVWGVIQSSFGSESSTPSEPEELYFPKPYNSEQLDIIDRLKAADGVVVQGPPGTGKTHTIANVICHYLAHGKRVLVTSSGEAALKVLRDKLPDGIKELVVTRLQNDQEGSRQLERSIRHIATEVASVSPEQLRQQIRDIEKRIDLLHKQLEGFSGQMRDWARSQTTTVPSDPEGRSPIEIAQLVYSQRDVYSWFPDTLGVAPSFDPQFDRGDVSSLRESRIALGADLQYLRDSLPSPSDLPALNVVVRLHEDLKRLAGLNQESLSTRALALANFEASTIESAETLLNETSSRINLLASFASGSEASRRVLLEMQQRADGAIAQELLKIRAGVTELEQLRVSRITSRVEIPDAAEDDATFRQSVTKLAAGESAGGLFKRALSSSFRDVLRRLKETRINTANVNDASGWSRVQDELATFDQIKDLAVRWNNIALELELPPVSGERYEKLKALVAQTAVVDDAYKFSPEQEGVVRNLVTSVFADPSEVNSNLFEESNLRRINESLELGLPHQRRGSFEQRRRDILEKFDNKVGTVVDEARQLLREKLGHLDVDSAWISSEWSRIIDILAKREVQRPRLKEILRVSDIIEENGAPKFAERLRTEAVLDGNDALLPDNLHEVWQLQRFASYLAEIDCHARLQKLMVDREKAEKQLASSYEELVRCRTWLELKDRLRPSVTSSLNAFISAIKSLGKGTGVRAERHRADARTAMSGAWEAIPCWIMSTARVSESLPARVGLFDLVIIDEASQSYIEAIPAIVRGKKILVVGDDEQISPTSFASEADINRYKEKYLKDLPKNFQAQLSPGKSLYDFARVVFPSGQVTLREHFRCVSAIIEFSNLLCYDGKIQCLRVPKPSERLDPPLIDVYVKGGTRQDKTNRAEAEAIVQEIEKISKTPGMENRSIGVISLVGNEQARIVNEELMARLGEELIRRHDIVCGDAHTLQGNERDIVFLSMIASPEDARSQTNRETKQRYNVAASRARDRMYLYRSVERRDLKEGDLKARLLDHFRAPLPSEEMECDDLRDKCESTFELAVFDELIKRGYYATPQVSSSGYRIDIVVEGDNDARLAIECDGDQYHGPEQWADDFKRQRILERAGWKFWRCWGSSFYRDPNACFEDLFAKLDSLGIKPRQAGTERQSSRFVEYREVDPFAVSSEPTLSATAPEVNAPETPIAAPATESVGESDFVISTDRERGRVDLDELVEYVFEDVPEQIHTLRVVELGTTSVLQGIVGAKSSLGGVILGSRVGDTFEVQLDGKPRLARIVTIHDIEDAETPPVKAFDDEQLALTLRPNNIPDGVTLHPYTAWKSRLLPDPRSAKPSEILVGLEEIVGAEGPISCERAFSLYAKAAGYQRLGADIKDSLLKALQAGINKDRIQSVNELRRKDRLKNILSIPGKGASLPRESGGRELSEVPPSELRVLLEQVIAAKGGGGDRNTIHREVVRLMGGNRLAASAREHLARVEEMMAQVELM